MNGYTRMRSLIWRGLERGGGLNQRLDCSDGTGGSLEFPA